MGNCHTSFPWYPRTSRTISKTVPTNQTVIVCITKPFPCSKSTCRQIVARVKGEWVNSPFAASGLGDRMPRLDLRKSLTSRGGRRRRSRRDAIGHQHHGFARMVQVCSRKVFNPGTDGRASEHGNRQNRRQNTEMKFRFCTIHETSFKSSQRQQAERGVLLVRASLGVGVPGCERTAKLLGIPSRQGSQRL
jgi:hypothetical protein